MKIVLSAYFQPHEDPSVIAGQIAWWCDELEDWTREQVVWALRKWNRDNSRLRPTPGDIVKICKAKRGQRLAAEMKAHAEPAQDDRRKVTKEEAEAILQKAGFAVKRMGQ